MSKQQPFLIILVLDRSGSMETIQTATVEGINRYVDDQKKVPGKCFMSFYQFDAPGGFLGVDGSAVETIYERKPIAEVPPARLEPRGMTPLNDALGQTITKLYGAWKMAAEKDRPRVAFVIVTDGMENASRQFTREQVAGLIKQATADGWDFVYLGANQDAIATAQSMSIPANKSMTYAANAVGTQAVYTSLSATTTASRAGPTVTMVFTDEDRKKQEEALKVSTPQN